MLQEHFSWTLDEHTVFKSFYTYHDKRSGSTSILQDDYIIFSSHLRHDMPGRCHYVFTMLE